LTIIGHGYGGKYATPISHGYGSLVSGGPPPVYLYREIWNDTPVSNDIYKPMAVNAGTEKFNGG